MNTTCPKCSNELKESPHNKFTGFKSYRCSNNECNALFDISDLKNNFEKFKFNKEELFKEEKLYTGGYAQGKTVARQQRLGKHTQGIQMQGSPVSHGVHPTVQKHYNNRVNQQIGRQARPNSIHNAQQTTMNLPNQQQSSSSVHPSLNSHVVCELDKNHYQDLLRVMGNIISSIAFDKNGIPRDLTRCPQYNSLYLSKKLLVKLLHHLYNPVLCDWPMSNLTKLDTVSKGRASHVLNNIDLYLK